jgi:hypothetical protein
LTKYFKKMTENNNNKSPFQKEKSHMNTATQQVHNTREAAEHTEGSVARAIEQQTAKLPSDLFLWAAAGAIGVSALLEFTGNEEKSRFVGQWVAPFLLLGLYNKIVKVAGSDRLHQ